MIDPSFRHLFPDVAAKMFSNTVTRRDREPDEDHTDQEHLALGLEELTASVMSGMPASTRRAYDPADREVQTSILSNIAAEALGIVRERAPDAYQESIAALFTLDQQHQPTRQRFMVPSARRLRSTKVIHFAAGFIAASMLWTIGDAVNSLHSEQGRAQAQCLLADYEASLQHAHDGESQNHTTPSPLERCLAAAEATSQ